MIRNRYLLAIDIVLIALSALGSFLIRLEADAFLRVYLPAGLLFVLVALLSKPLIFYRSGLYRQAWRYASLRELFVIFKGVTVGALVTGLLALSLSVFLADRRVPLSIPLIDWLFTLFLVGGGRLSLRVWGEWSRRRAKRNHWLGNSVSKPRRVLVAGAGEAGVLIVREVRNNPGLGIIPVGFVDDDESKVGVYIQGLPVLGTCQDIPRVVQQKHIDEVVIAMPTAPGKVIRAIRTICQQAGVPFKTMPGLYEILSGSVSVSQIRDVQIEDLLRREPVRTDVQAISEYLRGARVLVTGAGGSIGSEVCRQMARYEPESLILLGHGEHSIYHIDLELRRVHPDLRTHAVIADVRDLHRMRKIMARFQPTVVFHAAAHKHVPLMEQNIEEAVTNNIFGTYNVTRAAEEQGVRRFVLISTDKAVNPVSTMGATKRIAEMLVQDAAQCTRNGCIFVVVRFGNVLGSRGSVVPLFKQQIATGGPITVTHPEMRRYFMTIPEAVQLVIQAAAMGRGGEVFILDMGEPVRIMDLATDLVELSGLQLGQDIDIVFTGVRPGEKLCEELFLDGDNYDCTAHEKIFVVRNGQSIDGARLGRALADLEDLVQDGDAALITSKMRELVSEFQPTSWSTGPERG